MGKSDLCCPLESIKGITWGYETWPGLPEKFAEKLDNALLRRLVVVEVSSEMDAPAEAVRIIESSVENAEWTVTSLCVLCSYHSHNQHGKGEPMESRNEGSEECPVEGAV